MIIIFKSKESLAKTDVHPRDVYEFGEVLGEG